MARELDEGNLEETLESSSRAESRAESESGFTGSGSEPYSDEPVRNQTFRSILHLRVLVFSRASDAASAMFPSQA